MRATQMQLSGKAIGFAGSVHHGVQYTAEGHLLHAVGSAIAVLEADRSGNLRSEDISKVCCLRVSPSRVLLAVGRAAASMGDTAAINIWGLTERRLLHCCTLHRGKVQALAFSASEKWLASIGGPDDGALVIWDVATGKSLCGASVSATDVACFHHDPDRLATCGRDSMLCVWHVDGSLHKLLRVDAMLGQMRRDFTCLSICADDHLMYAGSASGDMAEVRTDTLRLARSGPHGKAALSAVTAVQCLPGGRVLCGCRDGRLAVLDLSPEGSNASSQVTIACQAQLPDAVSSLAPSPSMSEIAVGTLRGLYTVEPDQEANALTPSLLMTAHASGIHDVTLPQDCSDLLATCAHEDVRVWDVKTRQELLRVRVQGVDCLCLAITQAGESILVGCSDGQIRVFGAESGTLLHTMHDAAQAPVRSVAVLPDGRTVISGDEAGYVRVWRLGAGCRGHTLLATMKEHRAAINRLAVRKSGRECISASSDGSVIIWDLASFKRRASFSASTFFSDAAYCNDESQIVTAGSNRKLMYWDASTGELIRELESPAALMSLAMHPRCEVFASGDASGDVRVWSYDRGDCCALGQRHTGEVLRCAFSPCGSVLVSVDSHGAIMLWDTAALAHDSL